MYQFCLFALLVTLISSQNTVWVDLNDADPDYASIVALITDEPYTAVEERLDNVANETTAFFPSDAGIDVSAYTEEDVWYLLANGTHTKADIIALFGGNNAAGNALVQSLRDGTWFRVNGYFGSAMGVDPVVEPQLFTINGVPFTADGLTSDNGVVHTISAGVMWDAAMNQTFVEAFAKDAATFSTITTLLANSGLAGGIGDSQLTLFAPVNDAWTAFETAIGADNYTALTTLDVNSDLLSSILGHHVAPVVFFDSVFRAAGQPFVTIPTLLKALGADDVDLVIHVPEDVSADLLVSLSDTTETNATVTDSHHFNNAVVFLIDKVLLPDDFNTSWIKHEEATTGDATGDATTGDSTGDATTGDSTGDATTGDATTGDATGDATTGDATGDATTGGATTAAATTAAATTAAATTAAATTAAATTAAATTAAATTGAPPTTDSAASLVAGALVLLALLL